MGLTEKPLVQGIPADADMAKADIDDDENIDVETVPEYPPEFVELLKRVSDLEKCVYGRSRE